MSPLLADFIHARACKPFCEKSLTLPSGMIISFQYADNRFLLVLFIKHLYHLDFG